MALEQVLPNSKPIANFHIKSEIHLTEAARNIPCFLIPVGSF